MSQKAEAFAEFARSLNWDVEVENEGDKATVVAKAEGYLLSVSWLGEACLNECYWDDGEVQRKLRNAGASKRKLAELAETVSEPAKRSNGKRPTSKGGKPAATTRARRKRTPEPIEPIETTPHLPKQLPFGDINKASDEAILKAVLGRKVVWRNVLAGRYEEARVMDRPGQRHLRIDTNRRGERCLTWAAVEDNVGIGQDYRGPFRSVKLTSIIQIKP